MNENKEQEPIKMTKEEWKLYQSFVQNKDRFAVLLSAGVFDLKQGKAEINCHNGDIHSVNIHTRTYKRAVGNGIIPV